MWKRWWQVKGVGEEGEGRQAGTGPPPAPPPSSFLQHQPGPTPSFLSSSSFFLPFS